LLASAALAWFTVAYFTPKLIGDTGAVVPAALTPSAAAPRVWTVFVVFVAALGGAFAAQAIAALALAVWVAARGGDVRELPSLVTTPVAVVLLGFLGQLAFGAAALLAARFSPESAAGRLGLRRPALSGWVYPVLLAASLLPLVVGVGLSRALAALLPPNPAGQQMYERLTWPQALLFLAFVTLVPPVAEELLFRGYLQRRLLRRWRPRVAIPVTALLFAVVHIDPHPGTGPAALGVGAVLVNRPGHRPPPYQRPGGDGGRQARLPGGAAGAALPGASGRFL
jgi:membrane protease YdiL (CAAX protease family)